MQSINILLAAVQIIIAMSIVYRVLSMRYLEECTESELNRITDKIFYQIKMRGYNLLMSISAVYLVYHFDNELVFVCQSLLTVAMVFVWWSSMKQVVEFELILLKKQVGRVGREAAVARLHKSPS